jgi:hypothetical protein
MIVVARQKKMDPERDDRFESQGGAAGQCNRSRVDRRTERMMSDQPFHDMPGNLGKYFPNLSNL